MMIRFRMYRQGLLPLFLLMGGAAFAQVQTAQVLPLSSDPGRAIYAPTAAQLAKAQQRTAALALPFFDDFTSPLEGAPKAQNWMPSGGAFVSNRFALLPPTRGAATLDGLMANGKSYSGVVTSFYGATDSMESQPINLSGLTANDRVSLSFAWQAGSITGLTNSNSSTRPVRLDLFVKTDAGAWERVWSQNGAGSRTGFHQQVVALDQSKYLHGDFQFRFEANGNTSDNSDTWSIDYVLLDRNRTLGLADTTFADVAIGAGLAGGNPSGGLRSPLRRFAAMPVWQFNAASPPSSELSPALGVNLTNLNANANPVPITVLGTVRELPATASLGTWLQRSRTINANQRQDPETGPANSVALPTTATAKRLRYTLALTTLEGPRTLANDTISRDAELGTYYAYDDGTAESFTVITVYGTGQPAAFAYRFDLNQPDYVRGLRLYPVFTASDQQARSVTINVWTDASGQPSATPVATKTVTIPAPATYPAGWQYYEVSFDQPVRVTGTFWVGFSQPSANRFLGYGVDLNSSYPSSYFWQRSNFGVWSAVEFQLPGSTQRGGAPMMRPVMTNNIATATTASRDAADYSLYPNPTHGTVAVAGPAFTRATVLDALGRSVWEQPAAQAGQAILVLPTLPAGVYTVRLALPDGRTVSRRLLLE